jgi:tripartite ATP-independent transporter DctM subunit
LDIGLLVIVFIGLLAARVPVAIALFGSTLLFALVTGALPPTALASTATYGVDSFSLLAIPGFILVAEVMNRSTIAERIFEFSQSCVGHRTGGLAKVNVLGSLIFSGMSGSVIADVVGLGRLEMEHMHRRGYPLDFSAALTAASASIGPIIPPSIIMVVYAAAAGTSTTRLFLGGVLPGVVLGLFLMIAVHVMARGKSWGRVERDPWGVRGAKFLRALPALLTPMLIMGGIVSGYWTPTEAGAVASVYAFVVAKWFYRDVSWADIPQIFKRTAVSTGNIMLIFAGAHAFSRVVALRGVPAALTNAIQGATDSTAIVILLIVLVMVVGGMFMEPTPFLLITLPVLTALGATFDIDLVHLGLFVILTLMLGNLTPPFAMGLYAIADVADVRFNDLLRRVIPFYVPIAACILLIAFVPAIVLFLPNLLQ